MEDIQEFKKLTQGIKFAMLTTTSQEGLLKSRPMILQEAEFDGNLWFFADRTSQLAKDIHTNSKVNLAFASTKTNSYLSASGDAEVLIDRAKQKELWNPAYKAWFPEGLDDPKLSLIKVSVKEVDYWESPSSPMIHLVGFAKAILTGKKMETSSMGKHGHLNLN